MSDRIFLEDVVRCCHYLESDKATDRKKHADKLKSLLQHPQVRRILDEKSNSGKAKDGTYTFVFKSVQGYLLKESEAVRNKWDTLTVALQSTRKVKLEEICTLLRVVSKTAVKNGPRLRCSDIIESIVLILTRNFQSKLFGKTYLDILTEDLLMHRKYVNQITSEQYKNVLSYCCKCYTDPPGHLGSVQIAEVIKSLVDSVTLRFDPFDFNYLFDFFSTTVEIVRKSVQATFVEHSLYALHKFIKWQAVANQGKVVLFGQQVMLTLVSLMASKKISKSAQKLVIEICHLQVTLFVTNGGKEDCFYGNLLNSDEWYNILKSIVLTIERQISALSTTNKFNSKLKTINVDEEICALAADSLIILFQEFSMHSNSNDDQTINTTQFVSNFRTITFSQPSKVLSLLSTNIVEDVVCSVYWLQIISLFLQKLREPLSSDEVMEFATSFHQMFTNTKSHFVLCKIFSCLSALLCTIEGDLKSNEGKASEIWDKIVGASIRHMMSSLSSKTSTVFESCCRFLSKFLLVNKTHELAISTASLFPKIWQSYLGSEVFSEYFISFLCSFLHTHNLMEVSYPDHGCLATSMDVEDHLLSAIKKNRPTRLSLIEKFLGQTELETSMSAVCPSNKSSFVPQSQSIVNSSFLSGDRRPSCEETVSVKVMNMFVKGGSICMESVPNGCIVADLLISVCCKRPCLYFDQCQKQKMSSLSAPEINSRLSNEFVPIIDVCTIVLNQLRSVALLAVENLKSMKSLFSLNLLQVMHVANLMLSFTAKWKFDGLKKLTYSSDLLLTCICDELSSSLGHQTTLGPELTKSIQTFVTLLAKPLRFLIQHQNSQRKSLIVDGLKVALQTCGKLISKVANEAVTNIASPKVQNTSTGSDLLESASEVSFSDHASTSLESNSSRFSYRRKRYGEKPTDSPLSKRSNTDSNLSSVEHVEDTSKMTSDDASELFSKCVTFFCLVAELTGDTSVVNDVLNTLTSDEFDLTSVKNIGAVIIAIEEILRSVGKFNSCQLKNVIKSIQTIFQLHYQDEEISSNCLEVLCSLIPTLQIHNSDSQTECIDEIVSLLSIISDQISKDKCGPMMKVGYIECLVQLSKHLTFDNLGTSQDTEARNIGSVVKTLCGFASSPNGLVSNCSWKAISQIVQHQCDQEDDQNKYQQFCQYVFACLKEVKVVITSETSFASRNLNNNESFYLNHINSIYSCLRAFCGILQHTGHPLEKQIAEEICVFYSELEKSISERHSTALDDIGKVFKAVLTNVNKKFEYSILSQHLLYTLSKWEFSAKSLFKNFPIALWECQNMESFCRKNFDRVFPIVMLKSSRNLDEVIELLQNVPSLDKFKEECIPHAIAVTLPLLCKQGTSDLAISNSSNVMNIFHYLMQCCDYDHVSSLLQYFTAQIISHLLTMLPMTSHDDDHVIFLHENPPATIIYFDETSFEVILQRFVNLSLKDTKKHDKELNLKMLVKLIETSSQARMQNLMVHMYTMVNDAQNLTETLNRILAYRYFLQLIFPYISDDHQKEIVIHSVLHCVLNICSKAKSKISNQSFKRSQRHLINICTIGINLIFTLFSSSLNDDLSKTCKSLQQPMFVNPTMQILATIAQVQVQHSNEWSAKHSYQLKQLVSLLSDTKSICDAYKRCLHDLLVNEGHQNLHMESESTLDTPKMSDSSWGEKNVESHERKLNDCVHSMEYILQNGVSKENLFVLVSCLRNLATILPKACGSEGGMFTDDRGGNTIKQIIIYLSHICDDDEEVKELVAKCFGVLGLKSVGDRVVLFAPESKQEKSFSQVLLQIWHNCVDPNPSVQLAATECLINTLQHDSSALMEMKNTNHLCKVAEYLQTFRSTKKSNKKLEVSDPFNLLREKSMWSCDQDSYYDWLCENTWKLVKCCKTSHIRAMEGISRVSPKLCEKLFPFVFSEVGKSSAKSAELMGKCLNTTFQSALDRDGREINHDHLILMLGVVQHLREQDRKSCEEDHKDGRRSPKKDSGNVNKIEVDFLLAARVATICKRPFMAILFVELWIDKLELKLEKETESVTRGRDRKSTNRALSFSGDAFTEPKESTSDQKKMKQILSLRCQGLKSPISILQTCEHGSEAKNVLISAYDTIGESDGLNGCYSSYPINPVGDTALIHLSEKEGKWLEALKMYDLASSSGRDASNRKSKVVECLQQSGLDHLCDVYMREVDANPASERKYNLADANLVEVQYKAAWQSCQWDESLLNIEEVSQPLGFHQHLHRCMTSAFDDNCNNFHSLLSEARISCLSEFDARQPNHVITSDLHTVSCRLQSLLEIENVKKCLSDETTISEFLQSLNDFDENNSRRFRFDDVNLLLTVRSSVLSSLADRYAGSDSRAAETQSRHLLTSMRICCQHDRLQNAQKLLRQLSDVTSRLSDDGDAGHVTWTHKVKLEGAKLLWTQKEVPFALASLQNLLSQLESAVNETKRSSDLSSLQLMLAESLQTYGVWLHESRYEGPSVIMEDYLERSVSVADKVYQSTNNSGSSTTHNDSLQLLVKNYHMLAKFADEQYQQVIKYKKSSEYAQKRVLASAPKQELESMQQSGQAPARKTQVIVDKNLNIDKQELARVEEKSRDFLSSALRSYIQCVQLSDKHDILMYRICALWFENPNMTPTNSLMSTNHNSIPSYKYIPLSYQLAARLNTTTGVFQNTLREILLRVTIDHPHHVLTVILALVNAKKDEEFNSNQMPSSRRKYKKSSKKENLSSRVTAATTLLSKIRQRRPTLVQNTELVMNAYIEFANFDASPWKSQPNVKIELPKHVTLAKFADPSKPCPGFQDVVMPICNATVSKDADYSSTKGIVTFRYIKPYFETVGGVNLPKVLVAVGSDGVARKHLVKGKDDLRQDAVMQQVFETVNSLLRQVHDTSGLRIRTYRVTPLSQRSGLVEWCGGTTPIGTYLVGNSQQVGAHHRYRPSDIPVIKCRKMIGNIANQPHVVKLSKYKEICSSLRPVFRYFFTERFLDPAEWFAKRRAYSKSVAASSIVGYVLGLGDRHVQNILIDFETAELVHIDLGVAFEQGKCLPTPETVPFRLTRDIVDGMGATGVEGIYRRCCERTMQAMRSSYDIITTIVEVLLYDPLHEWTLTPSKAQHIQPQGIDNTEISATNTSLSTLSTTARDFMTRADEQEHEQLNTNKLAERVLLRLQEKLRGQEEGSVLSVCGQVNMLIQQASDPARLCQLFAGWQPYL